MVYVTENELILSDDQKEGATSWWGVGVWGLSPNSQIPKFNGFRALGMSFPDLNI